MQPPARFIIIRLVDKMCPSEVDLKCILIAHKEILDAWNFGASDLLDPKVLSKLRDVSISQSLSVALTYYIGEHI